MKNNKRLGVRVRVRFILFYSEFVPNNSRCITLQNLLLERKKYEEEISFEQPTHILRLKKEIFIGFVARSYWYVLGADLGVRAEARGHIYQLFSRIEFCQNEHES